MAEETKNIVEETGEVQENSTPAPAPAETNAAPAEDKVDEKKTTFTVPKWLVKTARAIEAVAAAFGAVVAGLMIKDTVTKRRRRRHYIDAPSRPKEISGRYPYEPTTSVPPVTEDIKVDAF